MYEYYIIDYLYSLLAVHVIVTYIIMYIMSIKIGLQYVHVYIYIVLLEFVGNMKQITLFEVILFCK